MPAAAVSSGTTAASGLWSQIQQQQAQRTAEQAEQKARALQAQARSAQSDADHAQEKARSLGVESQQAQGEAGDARRGVAAMKSAGALQAGLTDLRGQISQAVASLTPSDASPQPVVNVDGQETGTNVNIAV